MDFVVNRNVCLIDRKKYDMHRDRNWEVQAGSPDKIFDKKCLYV